MKTLIEKIVSLRKERRLSLAEVAEKLNIATSAYRKVETGTTALTVDRLYQLADIFGVSIEELMGLGGGYSTDNKSQEIERLQRELHDALHIIENQKSKLDLLNFRIDMYDATFEDTITSLFLYYILSRDDEKSFLEEILHIVTKKDMAIMKATFLPNTSDKEAIFNLIERYLIVYIAHMHTLRTQYDIENFTKILQLKIDVCHRHIKFLSSTSREDFNKTIISKIFKGYLYDEFTLEEFIENCRYKISVLERAINYYAKEGIIPINHSTITDNPNELSLYNKLYTYISNGIS